MPTIAVPYHLDERLEAFEAGLPVDIEITVDLADTGSWNRMAKLYELVAQVVAAQAVPPLVIAGDCTTSLGVLAGLQRSGRDVGIVWFDAHADFHTEQTTTSGYLGGMPLALAAGMGTLTLPAALWLHPVPDTRIVLVDARDTDPGEERLLLQSHVVRRGVRELEVAELTDGDLYLHVDVDVFDAGDVPHLLYPAPDGPSIDDVLAAVQRVVSTGRVRAVGLAATWHHDGSDRKVHRQVMRRLQHAVADRST